MKAIAESWLLQSDETTVLSRVPADAEYHRVFASERKRILRGVFVIVLLFGGLIIFGNLSRIVASLIDARLFGRSGFTPTQQAAGALALAFLIPYSMLLQRIFYGIPVGSLHSVAGRFRFALFGRTLIVFGPMMLTLMSLTAFSMPDETIAWRRVDLVAFFIIGMTLTPLAAAGEEYGLRGLMFRVVGSWTRGPVSGAVLGTILTTTLFSLAHGTLDPYLLGSYFVLFCSLAIITWRTGGLEVAIVLHGVYNVAGLVLATVLHIDLGASFNGRSEATGSLTNFLPGLGLMVITVMYFRATWNSGPIRTCRHIVTR